MVTYVDSHTSLIIAVVLIMFQYINVLEQYVFQDFIPSFRIAMRTYVDRMRDVRPKGGIQHTDITAIPVIIPTVGIESYAIIRIAQKDIINRHIRARHKV